MAALANMVVLGAFLALHDGGWPHAFICLFALAVTVVRTA